MEKHVTIIGILYIVLNALWVIVAAIIFSVLTGAGMISGDEEAIAITALVGIVVASFLGLISLPGIIGGIGLLKWQPWARILVLVLGFINLLNVPFGTVLGAYTIWALMNDETIGLFQAKAAGQQAAG
jgi:hypothetical protein